MKIYICERDGEVGYDEYNSFVVIAANEWEARALAQQEANESEWHPNGEFIRGKCTEVTDFETARVLLGSFNAG
jgi:hypothetical protein